MQFSILEIGLSESVVHLLQEVKDVWKMALSVQAWTWTWFVYFDDLIRYYSCPFEEENKMFACIRKS